MGIETLVMLAAGISSLTSLAASLIGWTKSKGQESLKITVTDKDGVVTYIDFEGELDAEQIKNILENAKREPGDTA